MKHLDYFNGAITRYFTSVSIDSRLVLNAVNAWVGEVEHNPDDSKITAKAKLSGKISAKGVDKRVVTITETEKRKAKTTAKPQGLLYALSTELDTLTEKHGVCVEIGELPSEIAEWAIRDSWVTKAAREHMTEAAKAAASAKADMEYGTATVEHK